MPIYQLFILILVFIGVVFLAKYVTEKYVFLYKKTAKNNHIKMIESYTLNFGQTLYLVQIGQSYHLMCGSKENLRYCCAINESDIGGLLKDEN